MDNPQPFPPLWMCLD